MEKRTIFGLIGLLVILFGVNFFFHSQRSKEMLEWRQERNEWIHQRIATLQEEIEEKTASATSLPIISLSSEASDKATIAHAIQNGTYYLTFPWKQVLPETTYANSTPLALEELDSVPLVLYRSNTTEKMPTVALPPIGTFDIQLVEFFDDPLTPPRIFYGTYTDGNFSLLSQEINTLSQELPQEEQRYTSLPQPLYGIALLKTGEGYRPVGLYNNEWNTIEEWQSWPSFLPFLAHSLQEEIPPSGATGQEKLFVLENETLQLDFSNFGGSVAEINLPFRSESNSISVVKPIQYDRDILDNHPVNAHFPLYGYYQVGKNGKATFYEEGAFGGYYPLLRRDLIAEKPRRSYHVGPEYYASNVISPYPEVAQTIYEVKEFSSQKIVFQASLPYRKVTKTYTLPDPSIQAPYCFDLHIAIEGNARGLWLTSGVPEVEIISNAPAPSIKYRVTRQKKADVIKMDPPKEATTISSIYPNWISNGNGFFGIIMDPLTAMDPGLRVSKVPGEVVPSRLIEIDDGNRFSPEKLPGYMTYLPLQEKGGEMSFRFFAGPYDSRILNQVDQTFANPETGYTPDYIASQTFHGWFAFISQPFAKFLFLLMNLFHQWTGSWAFSIILLTIALRVMLYPLNAWSAKSMMKMQMIAPKVQALQAKLKSDPKKGN